MDEDDPPLSLRDAATAHGLLVAVYQNVSLPIQTRLEAAKAAIAYEKPRLASVQHSGDAANPLAVATTVEIMIVDTVPNAQGDRPYINQTITNPTGNRWRDL